MSVTLRENITAVIETCFSETKDEIQEVAINRILELISRDKADRKTNCSEKPNNCEPQTIRCPKCGRSDYIREFGKDFSVTAEKAGFKYKCINCNTYIKTESDSEKQNNCDTCRFELYCPEMCEGCCEWDSHYEPKTEPQTEREGAKRHELK